MFQILRRALHYWAIVPAAPLEWPRTILSVAYRMPLPNPPSLALPQWKPDEGETAERYADRVAVEAKRMARKHTDASRRALMQSRDWRQVTPSRGAGAKREAQPVAKWLAMRVVCDATFETIASETAGRDGGVSPANVRKAVQVEADRIDLILPRTTKRN